LLHDVHVPFSVADEPFRNWDDEHLGRSLQVYPSVVPLHDPVLYCAEPHFALEHDVHVPLAVEDAPFRNSPAEHVGWSVHL